MKRKKHLSFYARFMLIAFFASWLITSCLIMFAFRKLPCTEFILLGIMLGVIPAVMILTIISLFFPFDYLKKRTLKKQLPLYRFAQPFIYESYPYIFIIDEPTGRFGYITNNEPFLISVFSAKDITDIFAIAHPAMIRGRTSSVTFGYSIEGKKKEFFTLVSIRGCYLTKSEPVQNAIAMANDIKSRLERAKAMADEAK